MGYYVLVYKIICILKWEKYYADMFSKKNKIKYIYYIMKYE